MGRRAFRTQKRQAKGKQASQPTSQPASQGQGTALHCFALSRLVLRCLTLPCPALPFGSQGRSKGGQMRPKMPREASETPKRRQEMRKGGQREARGSPREAKGRQRGSQGEAKGGQREAKGRPRGGQGKPKGGQREAKGRPREAKGGQSSPKPKNDARYPFLGAKKGSDFEGKMMPRASQSRKSDFLKTELSLESGANFQREGQAKPGQKGVAKP